MFSYIFACIFIDFENFEFLGQNFFEISEEKLLQINSKSASKYSRFNPMDLNN